MKYVVTCTANTQITLQRLGAGGGQTYMYEKRTIKALKQSLAQSLQRRRRRRLPAALASLCRARARRLKAPLHLKTCVPCARARECHTLRLDHLLLCCDRVLSPVLLTLVDRLCVYAVDNCTRVERAQHLVSAALRGRFFHSACVLLLADGRCQTVFRAAIWSSMLCHSQSNRRVMGAPSYLDQGAFNRECWNV